MAQTQAIPDMNRVRLIGTITERGIKLFDEDPDKRPFGQFSLKTSQAGLNPNGGAVDAYHQCKVFGKGLVNQLKPLFEGSRLDIFGSLRTRSYEVGGETKYITEVVVDPAHLTILEAVTEQPDPMGEGFDQEASDKANAEETIDQQVLAENNADAAAADVEAADANVGNTTNIEDDDIPF